MIFWETKQVTTFTDMCDMKIIVANFFFCHGTGYHLAHIPGIGLPGITSLNNVCKFERNNIF